MRDRDGFDEFATLALKDPLKALVVAVLILNLGLLGAAGIIYFLDPIVFPDKYEAPIPDDQRAIPKEQE